MFPNPSLGEVTIKVNQPAHVKVSDLMGNVVFTSRVTEKTIVSHLRPGTYVVNVTAGRSKFAKKLVIR